MNHQDRQLMQQALDYLERHAVIDGVPLRDALRERLSESVAQPAQQKIEQCVWARNGNTPCPHVQPAQEVDWEKLYRLEVKKKEALAAKYERDTGKQLTRIVPMNQPAQQEPVAWLTGCPECGMDGGCGCDSGTWNPPASKPWVGLTDEEISGVYSSAAKAIDYCAPSYQQLARAIEAKLKEKNT